MIEGLKLDIKAEELIQRLEERIAHHRSKAESYGLQLEKLGEIQPIEEEEDILSLSRGRESPRITLERKLKEHMDRAAILKFLRDHVVQGEVYRLSEHDLRLAEILPDRYTW